MPILAGLLPAALLATMSLSAKPAAAAAPDWLHQLGTTGAEYAEGVAVDAAGSVYATGITDATVPGSPGPNAGGEDVFVASWDSTGAQRWVHQLGTTGADRAWGIGVDGSGNVYLTGYTEGVLPGSSDPAAGGGDLFVASWTNAGVSRWVRQLGSPMADYGIDVAVDAAGDVYVTGYTYGMLPGSPEANAGLADVFVASWDSTGTSRWVHQLGTAEYDFGQGVAVDATGNVYVTGDTDGTLPGSSEPNAGYADAFVASWTATGTQRWTHQLGFSGTEAGDDIAVDGAGNVYVTGDTDAMLPGSPEPNAGGWDLFVASWDGTGTSRWVHQLGSPEIDIAGGMAVDPSGNVYATGYTSGTLPGSAESNAGGNDVFLASWDGSGTSRWAHQLGSTVSDTGGGVAVGPSGNVYATGYTAGTLPGAAEPNAGSRDAFVAKWSSGTPPPADTVEFAISGALSYTNSQPVTSGGISITRDANGIKAVTGTATFASTVSADATVTTNVSRFWILPIYTGSVRLIDTAAAVSLNHPILFSRVNPASATGATNTQGWIDFSQVPWKGYTMTWIMHDLA